MIDIPGSKNMSQTFKDEEPKPRHTKKHQSNGVPEEVGDRDAFLYVFSDGQVAKISNSIWTGGVKATGSEKLDRGHNCLFCFFFRFFHGFWHFWAKVAKNRPMNRSEKKLARTWPWFCFFFVFP